jgi:3-deoxy-D-manno-octulosonic-acid transferase
MICYLLDFGYLLFLLLSAPFWLYRLITQGRYRAGWKQRLGFVPKRYSEQPCIWIHAVSVGEVNAMATLIKTLQNVLPQFEIAISSTTDTGFTRAQKLYEPSHRVFYFPFDFSFAQKLAFKRLRPRLCILMELEIWHNFTAIAQKLNIPVIVANGRISSAKGFPRYRKVASLIRPMFRRLSLVLAQDCEYADRFRFLGVDDERLQVVGSLKYDTAPTDPDAIPLDDAIEKLRFRVSDLIWVAGSTGPGEEEILLDTFAQLQRIETLESLRLVIVPRKPERFEEVARLIESRGYKLLRFSHVKADRVQPTEADTQSVIFGDTMGDLQKFYKVATIIFVGRSLAPMGGSDMMEAAALAKPVIVGPYTENFTETMKFLSAGRGIEVVADGQQLTEIAQKLLTNTKAADAMAQNAQKVILENQGATRRTIDALLPLLDYQCPHSPHSIATPLLK